MLLSFASSCILYCFLNRITTSDLMEGVLLFCKTLDDHIHRKSWSSCIVWIVLENMIWQQCGCYNCWQVLVLLNRGVGCRDSLEVSKNEITKLCGRYDCLSFGFLDLFDTGYVVVVGLLCDGIWCIILCIDDNSFKSITWEMWFGCCKQPKGRSKDWLGCERFFSRIFRRL